MKNSLDIKNKLELENKDLSIKLEDLTNKLDNQKNLVSENIKNTSDIKTKLELEIKRLMQDEDVTKKSGIYEYVLTRNEKFLNIYGEIEFVIVEKDEDEFNISLNKKFTIVPFFYMVIQNQFLQNHKWKYVLGIILGLLLLYCILKARA